MITRFSSPRYSKALDNQNIEIDAPVGVIIDMLYCISIKFLVKVNEKGIFQDFLKIIKIHSTIVRELNPVVF